MTQDTTTEPVTVYVDELNAGSQQVQGTSAETLQSEATLRMETAKWLTATIEAGERGDLREGKFVIPSTEVREYIESDPQLARAASEILQRWSTPVRNRADRRALKRQLQKRRG